MKMSFALLSSFLSHIALLVIWIISFHLRGQSTILLISPEKVGQIEVSLISKPTHQKKYYQQSKQSKNKESNSHTDLIQPKKLALTAKNNKIQNHYLSELRSIIENRKEYPLLAKRMRQTGKVIISFTLKQNGEITDIHITHPCPFARLNHAAKELIVAIEKYRAIPKELGLAQLHIEQPIIYELN